MKKENSLHPRNLHQGRYDLEALAGTLAGLKEFIITNEFGNLTLDFANPKAVKSLNQALLKHFYQVEFWELPDGYLCPPIPGRADYIHYIADLLRNSNKGKIPNGPKVRVLDIGTGANLIYPLLGSAIYGWSFVGSELSTAAINSGEKIIGMNSNIHEKIEIRNQPESCKIFSNIIKANEFFDLTICNPPFHESAQAAQEGSERKVKNLGGKSGKTTLLNFGGQAAELWTEGGELEFIRKMIQESLRFKAQVYWFTTLVSKSENLKPIKTFLKKAGVFTFKTIQMAQGNKQSRFVAWTFLTEKQQENWRKFR